MGGMKMSEEKEKRQKSQERAAELKESIRDYRESLPDIPSGYKDWERIKSNQEKIRSELNISEDQWYDWEWQLANRFNESGELSKILPLSKEESDEIDLTGSQYRWAVSPYYLSLIDWENSQDPVRRQSIPTAAEYHDNAGILDPMGEEYTSPAPAITRRYPDRLIINITNKCAMYCRHCQRRRNIGETDTNAPQEDLEAALDYIRNNEEIRDVLLTGGDAFMLDNDTLDWLLTELDEMPHVEIKRLGSRVPVTLPYRIDDELCNMLSKHLPLYVNTQFNHPLEVTPDAGEACLKLARSGIALGNQAVLLKGVNNDSFVMRKLNQELLKIMVRPYYIFHAKAVKGTTHFRTKVEEGIEVMEKLRGYTSGLAIPSFIVNSPYGYGKTPVLPNYLVNFYHEKICLRTWENRYMEYENEY